MRLRQLVPLAALLFLISSSAAFAHGIGVDWQQQSRELSSRETAERDDWMAANQQARELSRQKQFDAAAAAAEKALELARKSNYLKSVGAEGVSLCNLASCYYNQKKYAQAETAFGSALAYFEKSYGPDDPSVAAILNNLGSVEEGEGHAAKAELLYKRALEIDEKKLGPDHPDVAVALKNLAGVYRYTHRDDEAAKLEQRAAAIEARKR